MLPGGTTGGVGGPIGRGFGLQFDEAQEGGLREAVRGGIFDRAGGLCVWQHRKERVKQVGGAVQAREEDEGGHG